MSRTWGGNYANNSVSFSFSLLPSIHRSLSVLLEFPPYFVRFMVMIFSFNAQHTNLYLHIEDDWTTLLYAYEIYFVRYKCRVHSITIELYSIGEGKCINCNLISLIPLAYALTLTEFHQASFVICSLFFSAFFCYLADDMHDLYALNECFLHFQIDQGSFHQNVFGRNLRRFYVPVITGKRHRNGRGKSRTETIRLTDSGHDERNKRELRNYLLSISVVFCR